MRALADAVFLALRVERVGDRVLGRVLQVEVDGRLHHDVLLDGAEVIGKHVHHPVGDVVAAAAWR